MSLLAEEVVLPELDVDSTESLVDRTQDAADGLCLLAHEALLDTAAALRFIHLILKEPRALDLGLLIALSYLCSADQMLRGHLRSQEFYPAILLDRSLADISGAGRPAVRLLSLVISHDAADSATWAALGRAAAKTQRGFGRELPWPAAAIADEIAQHAQKLRPRWEERAGELLHVARGGMASETQARLRRRLAGWLPAHVDLESLLADLPSDLEPLTAALRGALTWPQRTSALFRCLAGDLGWLRLYFAYLCRITPAILRHAARTPDAVVEIVQRELVWPCAHLLPLLDEGIEPASLWKQPEFSALERKRLQRMRESCIDGPLEDPGEGLIMRLREVATLYYGLQASGRRR